MKPRYITSLSLHVVLDVRYESTMTLIRQPCSSMTLPNHYGTNYTRLETNSIRRAFTEQSPYGPLQTNCGQLHFVSGQILIHTSGGKHMVRVTVRWLDTLNLQHIMNSCHLKSMRSF